MHRLVGRGKELLDIARSLADAVLVLDQREADVIVAELSEADARGDGDIRLLDEQLGEFQRAEMTELFRDLRPGEHGRGRRRHFEAGLAEALDHHVAAALVDIAHFRDVRTVAVQRMGRGHLDRREGAVVEIGLHARQGGDQALVADGKAHAPAGHGKGFRHGGELHRDVHGAGNFQHGRRRRVVEVDFRIGKVGQNDDVVLLRKRDDVLVEIERGDLRRRVRRIVQDQRQRLRDRVAHGALERREEGLVRLHRNGADDAAGHQEAEGVDRIGRVRAEDDVARRGDGLRHVGEAFLGAEGRDDLRLRVQLHAEAAGVIGGLRAAETGNALGRGIAVRARVLDHFAQLVDNGFRRRQVGVAHAKVDDVGAARSRACFQTVDLFENIWRQTPDLVKLFHL